MKRIKVKFKPRNRDKYHGVLIENCTKGDVYNFIYAYTLEDGSEYYEPCDINFPDSTPINILDLELIE